MVLSMKKFLFGAIVLIVAMSSCFSHEQKKQVNRWWVPEKKDLISWEKLDTIVVGDGLKATITTITPNKIFFIFLVLYCS